MNLDEKNKNSSACSAGPSVNVPILKRVRFQEKMIKNSRDDIENTQHKLMQNYKVLHDNFCVLRDQMNYLEEQNKDFKDILENLHRELEDDEDDFVEYKDTMLKKVMNLENKLKNCVGKQEWAVIKRKLDEFEIQISKISSSVEKVNKLFSSTDENLINAELYERIKKLEHYIESQDKQMRMRNIIIKGLKKGNSGTREEVAEMLKKELFVEPEIEECQVIREGSNSADRIIMVKLKNYEDKRIIMTRRVLLKGKNFIIHDDLTQNERQAQFFIRERAREERIKGAFVKVFRGKLFVNGECWVYAQNYVNADDYRFIKPIKETAV